MLLNETRLKVVDPQKLDLRQKQIILLSIIAILLLKGYFGREKINFHEKNFKFRKIISLINLLQTNVTNVTFNFQTL